MLTEVISLIASLEVSTFVLMGMAELMDDGVSIGKFPGEVGDIVVGEIFVVACVEAIDE